MLYPFKAEAFTDVRKHLFRETFFSVQLPYQCGWRFLFIS